MELAADTPSSPNAGQAIVQLVYKVQSNCNFACPNCYVYAGPDQSWSEKPPVMSDAVLAKSAERAAEHAVAHDLPYMDAIFHGGEPTMNGVDYFVRAAGILRAAMPADTQLRLGMQTNGLLLTPRTLAAFKELNIRLGISLDGPEAVHNNQRPLKNKNHTGSYRHVRRALELLSSPEYRDIFSGILCTVDPHSNPAEVHAELMQYAPPAIDYLIPHATWESPPSSAPGEMGTWLGHAFYEWARQESTGKHETTVRLFKSAIAVAIGLPSQTEQLGSSPAAMTVIETDGTYEQVDTLKVAYAGAPETGLNVFEHSLDDVLQHEGIRARQLGLTSLSETCQRCDIVDMCGGGHYVHRYSKERGFDNPSVYCEDMKIFLPFVRDTVRSVQAREQQSRPAHNKKRAATGGPF